MRNRHYINEEEDWWDDARDYVKDKAHGALEGAKEMVRKHGGDALDAAYGATQIPKGVALGGLAGTAASTLCPDPVIGTANIVAGMYKGGKKAYQAGRGAHRAVRTGIESGARDFGNYRKAKHGLKENAYINEDVEEGIFGDAWDYVKDKASDAWKGAKKTATDFSNGLVRKGKEAAYYAKTHLGDILDKYNGAVGGARCGADGAVIGGILGSPLGPAGIATGSYLGGKNGAKYGYKGAKWMSNNLRKGVKAVRDDKRNWEKKTGRVNENAYIKNILREELEAAADANAETETGRPSDKQFAAITKATIFEILRHMNVYLKVAQATGDARKMKIASRVFQQIKAAISYMGASANLEP